MPLTELYASPFSMILGDHIYATITANNLYGSSLSSVPGDGAAIVYLPDAPLYLANNPAQTNANQIGITWSPGISNGGRPILDYKIWYDQGTNSYTSFAVVTTTSYTLLSLTPGNTYKIKIQARNSVGYSSFSNEVSILASQVPSQPAAPQTTVSSSSVIVTWVAPYNGGSPITKYTITFRQSDGLTFTEDTTNCNGALTATITSMMCTINFSVFT